MSQQPETERAVLLRWFELRLLRCTLTSPPSDSSPPPQPQPSDQHQTHTSLLNDLLSSIEAGDYLRALSFDAARLVLQQLADDEASSADRFYSESLLCVEYFLVSESEDDEDKAYSCVPRFHLVQHDWAFEGYGKMSIGIEERWDMAPYIEAIDSQQLSYFIIQCFCDILRIRWESTRSHTKERALLMMDKLF
ncbi:hypothetical protein SO802_007801 [Lithocarpus litseifolius]|uniref:Uncharacterized protein n=1 Tax=Lithocarpus litseifolius TaxID=425828 RepID=A0AAW2DPZ3_9ROSI